ncbi:MAG TPA: ComEA family DNA-binding protein, partial [Methylophilaceae bacterium]|nr:ComEA family DNA-binding protein [Methylophilaceae bacterium]
MKKILLAFIAFLSFSLSAFAAVNINTATQAELETLDGVGPVKAQAIIDYRKKNGNFKSVDDLEKVEGIGPVTLQNVRKDVTLSGATTAVAKPSESKATKEVK